MGKTIAIRTRRKSEGIKRVQITWEINRENGTKAFWGTTTNRNSRFELIQEHEQKVEAINSAKKHIYSHKYSMWEMNAEIFELQE